MLLLNWPPGSRLNLFRCFPYTPGIIYFGLMKKIDILNFITNSRKAPNDIKTHTQIVQNFNISDASQLDQIIAELRQTKVLRETELNGEKAYQVVTK